MNVFVVLTAAFGLMFFALLLWVIHLVREVIRVYRYEQSVKYMNYKKLNAFAKHGQTVFSGDSITEQCVVAEWYADYAAKTGRIVYNRGVGGETSGGLLKNYSDAVLALEPSTVVFLIGTNDLALGVKEGEIVKNVSEVIRMTRERLPGTKIILQAVHPVNPSIAAIKGVGILAGKKRTNRKIDSLNIALEALAKDQRIRWIDNREKLRDASALLKPAYSHDGLHLNAEGYAAASAAVSAALIIIDKQEK
jgi:lysophospholipase L1-like esterase